MDPGRISAWIGVASALVTIWLTVDNRQLNKTIEGQKFALQQKQAELTIQLDRQRVLLEERKQDVNRYEFVQKVLPNLLKQGREQVLTLNLVRIVLTEDESRRFLEGLPKEGEFAQLSQVAAQARVLVTQERSAEIKRLVLLIDSADRNERLRSTAQLVSDYKTRPDVVSEVLDLFSGDRIDRLSATGRINALYVLTSVSNSAWSPESLERADGALRLLESRQSTVKIGDQTREAITRLRGRLSAIRTGS